MFKAILNALFGRSASRHRHEHRDKQLSARDDDYDLDDDDDDVASFEVGGRQYDPDRPKNWWAVTFPPNRPEGGPWRIALQNVLVAGTQHRRDDVSTFVHDVEAIQKNGAGKQFRVSITLEREPSNPHDRNAVKVIGEAAIRPGKRHLGYLPRELSAELTGEALPPAEGTRYYERDDYSELKINILEARPSKKQVEADRATELEGVDVSSIKIDRRKNPADHLAMAKDLKRAGRVEDAAALLEKLTAAYKNREDGPPGAWTDLAIIYRQRKDYAAEVALLESFMASKMARGLTAEKMAGRLEKARALAEKKT